MLELDNYAQRIALLCSPPEPGWLEEAMANGQVRAAASLDGEHAYVLMAETSDADLSLCGDPTQPPCKQLHDTPILNRLSFMPPFEIVVLITVQVARGRRREYAELLAGDTSTRDDFYVAASHTFGARGIDVMIEITGNDREEVFDKVLELTDLDLVIQADVHVTRANRTVGFGQAPRRRP